MKDKFCMLANQLKGEVDLSRYLVSEKMNGIRCLWDGGASRGIPCSEVPYANIEKDGRYVVPPVSTGLWTRYGKSIQAPEWFLNKLPDFPLDGELWLGYGQAMFQELKSVVSQLEPDSRWERVSYLIFDTPPWDSWVMYRSLWGRPGNTKLKPARYLNAMTPFEISHNWLIGHIGNRIIYKNTKDNCVLSVLSQLDCSKGYNDYYNNVLDKGGEGVMLRCKRSVWVPKRSQNLLKVKPFETDIGVVVGVIDGEGKHTGRMGAIRISWNGVYFNVGTGFTDDEREEVFNVGDRIVFKYRDVSRDMVPIEARYVERA